MERYAKLASEALAKVLPKNLSPPSWDVPPNPKLGDFAFACFSFAKAYKKPPAILAKELAELLKKNTEGALSHLSWNAVGPYLNATIAPKAFLPTLLKDILSPTSLQYGQLPHKSRPLWVLEFSSPNVAKNLQIYHLRSTLLGAALSRIGAFRGHPIIRINHLGDWGKQYGMLLTAFEYFHWTPTTRSTLSELVDLYVRIHQEVKLHPELEDRARELFAHLEQGDPQLKKLWKLCVDISMEAFEKIYQRFSVEFDLIRGESTYLNRINEILKDLKSKKLLFKSEGAQIVSVTNASGKELPPCLLKKKDGTTLYATRDLAAAIERYEAYRFDKMIYITGREQILHFEQVFSVLRQMGFAWAEKLEHLPTGMYLMGKQKMSTRQGRFMTAEQVVELVKEKISSIIRNRELKIPKEHLKDTIEQIAIGAVCFFDLRSDPMRDIYFNLENVLDFDGPTGPYLQYAHTRTLSLIRKAKEQKIISKDPISWTSGVCTELKTEQEHALVKKLGFFPLALERSLTLQKASPLAQYLIEVSQLFNSYYKNTRILTSSHAQTLGRVQLTQAIEKILAQGMKLLGIPIPKWM